jgi:hypothetical protein
MSKVHKRRRSPRELAARRRFLAGLVLFILALGVAIYLGAARHLPNLEPVPLSATLTSPALDATPAAARVPFERDTYPYSVIDGGAANVEELKAAMARDPVVAAHYVGFAIDRTHVEQLTQPRLAHVSYRIGNSVFWTRKPVVVKAGETVLTDGLHVARTRCGNQLADRPAQVSPMEPAPGAMDAPLKSGSGGSSLLALLRPPASLPAGLGGQLPAGDGMSLPSGEGTAGTPGLSGSPIGGVGANVGAAGGTKSPQETSPPPDTVASPADPPGSPATPPAPPDPPTIPGPTPPAQTELPLPPLSPGNPNDWTPPPTDGRNPGGLIPVGDPGPPMDPPDTPVDPPGQQHEPLTVPEPGTTLLLAGGVVFALRRIRTARC